MCGISGIVSYLNDCKKFERGSIDFIEIAKLQDHRGPNYFGVDVSKNYIFCHNRLSIIDTSTNSNQPILDDNFVLIYNGEIYNYIELANKYSIKDKYSDTIVLFQLLKLHGKSIISELNGMFAIAFYNKLENNLILCRDRMGIKPLFYNIFNDTVIFASELKIILKYLNDNSIQPKINQRCFDELIMLKHIENNSNIYDTIISIKPGEIIEILNDKSIINTTYYSIINEISNKTNYKEENYLIDELDELLYNSVKLHLISDVKIGTLCSGGIDSSLITSIATKINPNISIYHAGVDGNGGEEKYAELVAKFLNVNIQYIKMNSEKFISLLPLATYYSDLPIYHPNDISLYSITQAAKQDGTTVLLAGEGADELFGGYSWHQNFKKKLCQNDNYFLKFFGKINKYFYNNYSHYFYTEKTNKQFFSMSSSYINNDINNIYNYAYKNALLLNKESWDFQNELFLKYKEIYLSNNDAMLASYISNNLFGHLSTLLHRNDRMSMANSIETRVPFIENKIIEFAINLDIKYKIKNNQTKYLLKKVAERYIPKSNIYRPKAGFPVPWNKYMSNVNKNIFKDGFLINYLKLTNLQFEQFMDNCTSELLFSMLSIEIWGRVHILKEKYWDVEKKIKLS